MSQEIMQSIELDFGAFVLEAQLFDTAVAKRFAEGLPYAVELTRWGRELYGPIGRDLGEENPVPEIETGGLAYTNRGHLVCIFFGQSPAWPVEFIGRIKGDQWEQLLGDEPKNRVEIR